MVFVLIVNSAWCAIGQTWTLTSAPTNELWRAVASSADGNVLVAVSSTGIYASTNGGADWTHASAPAANWAGVAASTDGTKLVAVVDGGFIYTSTDAGETFKVTSSPSNSWQAVVGSGDGTRLVAASGIEFSSGGIYTSTNSGATWVASNAPTNGYGWYSVASSADGTKLAAMLVDLLSPAGPIGPVYTSTNSGATWTNTMQNFGWPISLASTADGAKLVAGQGVKGFPLGGSIYISADAGATGSVTTAPVTAWSSIASSADGTHLVAGVGGTFSPPITGPIYTSVDSGTTWTATESPTNYWASVASSADGMKLVAVVNGGGIYTRQATPSPVLSATASNADLMFSWTVPSVDFHLEQASDLTSGNWTAVPGMPTLNYTNLQYQSSIAKPQGTMFYRLVSK